MINDAPQPNEDTTPTDPSTDSGYAPESSLGAAAEANDATAEANKAVAEERENSNDVPTRPEQSEEDVKRAYDVEEFMRDVIDPELGINVVDLGLVYDIWIENGDEAVINMTLTSPACPLTDVLEDQTQQAVVGSGTASKVTINWVWMPPWGPQMITEDGREQLRALGFSV